MTSNLYSRQTSVSLIEIWLGEYLSNNISEALLKLIAEDHRGLEMSQNSFEPILGNYMQQLLTSRSAMIHLLFFLMSNSDNGGLTAP